MNGGYGVVDPGADCWVPVLVDCMVIRAGGDERVGGVEAACVEKCMECHRKEVAECQEKGLLGVKDRWMWRWLLWHTEKRM